MFKNTILCLIAIAAVTIVQTRTTEWWDSNVALQLDNNNFDELIKTNKYTIVNFYSKYSVESQKIAPEYEKIAEKYMGPERTQTDVIVALIDGSTYEAIAAANEVHVFPEILLFTEKGAQIYRFDNEYIGEKMIDWVEGILNLEQNSNEVTSGQAVKVGEKPYGDSDFEELGVALDSVMVQSEFSEVVNKVLSMTSDLESAINENLHKIEELMKFIESHKSGVSELNDYFKDVDQILRQLEEEMYSAKANTDLTQPLPTRRYLEEVKVTLDEVKTHIYEQDFEEKKSSSYNIFFVIGLLGGAGLVYFAVKSGDKKKARKSIYD